MAFIKPEYDDDSNMEIKEEPFDSNVDEEKYEPNDQNLCEDNSTNGDYEDLPSTSRANDKRSTKRPAQEETPSSGKRYQKQMHTNQEQYSVLVKFLKDNKSFARGALNAPQYKQKTAELWESIAVALNSHGPPTKNADAWKKVWKDFKYNIKKKLRHNMKCSRATDSGPNKQQVFSSLEEDIVELLDLRASESGMDVRTFGAEKESMPQSSKINQINLDTPSGSSIENRYNVFSPELPDEIPMEYNDVFENTTEPACTQPATQTSSTSAKKLLEKQVSQQDNYQTKMLELLENQNINLLKQNKYLQRQNKELRTIAGELKKTRKLKQHKMNLLKRQFEREEKENDEKLKIRLAELEIKRRKLDVLEGRLKAHSSNSEEGPI